MRLTKSERNQIAARVRASWARGVLSVLLLFLAYPASADITIDTNVRCFYANECIDGIDNDSNGLTDIDGDSKCANEDDSSEVAAGQQDNYLVCDPFPVNLGAGLEVDPSSGFFGTFIEIVDVPGLVDGGVPGDLPYVTWEGGPYPPRELIQNSSSLFAISGDDPAIPNLLLVFEEEVITGPSSLGQLRIDLPLPENLVMSWLSAAIDPTLFPVAVGAEILSFTPLTSRVLDDYETGTLNVSLTAPGLGGDSSIDLRSGSMVGGTRRTNFSVANTTEGPLTGELTTGGSGQMRVNNAMGLTDRLETFYGFDQLGELSPLALDLRDYDVLELDFDYLGSVLNLNVQLRAASGPIGTVGFNVLPSAGAPFTHHFPMDAYGLGSATQNIGMVGIIGQTGGMPGSEYAISQFRACNGQDPTCGLRVAIDFDEDPEGVKIPDGTSVEGVYQRQGVLFARIGDGVCGPEVYANADQPDESGSAPNVVSPCNQNIASDFSEAEFGLVEARFAQDAIRVCIDVIASDGSNVGVIRGYDAAGVLVDSELSEPGLSEQICVVGSGIRSAQFAGHDVEFARFDNLEARFVPEPTFAAGALCGIIFIGAAHRRRSQPQS